jgi:hypothetical protein
LRRLVAIGVTLALLALPAVARANGDPASDYLLVRSIFLPFNAKIDQDATERLSATVRKADKAAFRIKVALIASRYDLGTAFSLYNKPQRYAQFLGLELSFQYRGRLLVVMPNGFGYAVNGEPDPRAVRALRGLGGPGKDATRQAQAAIVAVRRLAEAGGHRLSIPNGGGAGSAARDRITIAAAATAALALIAGFVLFRRQRRTPGA